MGGLLWKLGIVSAAAARVLVGRAGVPSAFALLSGGGHVEGEASV